MVTNEKLWKNCRERVNQVSVTKGDEKSTEGDEKNIKTPVITSTLRYVYFSYIF